MLLAEDDATNRMVACSWLAQAGIEVQVACNGREAIAKLQRQPEIALILMDIHMPELDGLEATRTLRQQGHALPIIGLSAAAGQQAQAACFAAGMNDFLSKPIDLDELWGCLTRWLQPGQPVVCEQAPDAPQGDADMHRQLRQLFLQTHGNAAQLLQAAIEHQDKPQLAFLAHRLQGAAALVGLTNTAMLARHLEQQLGMASDSELKAFCRSIKQDLQRFATDNH